MKPEQKKVIDHLIGSSFLSLLKLPILLSKKILNRDHSLEPKGDILVIKMLGGGSLVIAYQALFSLKRKFPDQKIKLLTTKGVKPFADLTNIFDEVIIIDETSLFSLLKTSIEAIKKLFRIDTVLDFEVHSQLTTLFSLILFSRNRIGFYRDHKTARSNAITHKIYFNYFHGTYYFYEEMVSLLTKYILPFEESKEYFIKSNNFAISPSNTIGIFPICSELGRERMLKPNQWLEFCKNQKLDSIDTIYIFGGPNDLKLIEEIKMSLAPIDAEIINLAGKTSLKESLNYISNCSEVWSIDSGLLHFARLIGIPSKSIWGPTAPFTRLKKIQDYNEKIYYNKIPCSPCIHVMEFPPCLGVNKCINQFFEYNKWDKYESQKSL